MSATARPITLIQPRKIECGPGTAPLVGEFIWTKSLKSALVVADAFNADRIGALALPDDCAVTVFAEVKPEPDIANLDALLAVAGACKPEVVIGFGGGSAMDIAKLASVLAGSGKTVREVEGKEKAPARTAALIQVPTTAGTGSEVGNRALVTDPEAYRKIAVDSLYMLADLAVIDPNLTATMPPAVTAATGIDALTHCVESFTNKNAHPAIDLYAQEGIRLAGQYLARAVADGTDTEARMGMSLASMYGGLCLGPVNTAAGHAISYPLGTRHAMPHGLANALIFPYVLAFNAPACPEKTGRILGLLGLKSGGTASEQETFDLASQFCAKAGIDVAASIAPLAGADLEAMADEAFAIKRLLDNNPRDVARNDILNMYRHLVGQP